MGGLDDGGAGDLLTGAGADERPSNDVATTALVLGVLSVVLSVLTGVPALVAGIVGLVRARRLRTGAVRSVAAVVLGLASVAVAVLVVRAVVPVWQTAQELGRVGAEDVLVSGSPQARAATQEAAAVLEEVGVDPASLDCGSPAVGLQVDVACTGETSEGAPAVVEGSCPASVVTGEAVCVVSVDGEEREVLVRLRDGVPQAELLPR